MSAPEQVTVTQADRHLFKMVVTGMVVPTKHKAIDQGGFDEDLRMQFIARHRIAAEAESAKAIAELVGALEPFAKFADAVTAANGWKHLTTSDSLTNWFGRHEFIRASAVLARFAKHGGRA